MASLQTSVEKKIGRLHAPGIVDFHFDMPMDLYEKRGRANVLDTEYLAELKAGDTGVLGVAIYIEDRYLPEMALRVALDQVARIRAESDASGRFAICKNYEEICRARQAGKVGVNQRRQVDAQNVGSLFCAHPFHIAKDQGLSIHCR